MKILLTGANGYIGTRLLTRLTQMGHEVYPLVRSLGRYSIPEKLHEQVHPIEGDLLHARTLQKIPEEIDAAYYLVHSMSHSRQRFVELEALSAGNFQARLSATKAKQIIYLGGISNEAVLSRHLSSRKRVDEILRQGSVPVTTLMAGIIIGSGSASFEIMRDLVEKLPVMVAPRWIKNLSQPIAISDVLDYLTCTLMHPGSIGERFEIGGPDRLSYREMLLRFARIRKLKRVILSVPVLTPRLSSYWLYFVTTASYPLARSLVESLKNNAVCKEERIKALFPKKLLSFEEAVQRAFDLIRDDKVASSWKDAFGDSELNPDLAFYIQVPEHGVCSDLQQVAFSQNAEEVKERVWSIGGERGWLYMDWAWKVRGQIDKLAGGIGLRRGRTHPSRLKAGDALDFWRVVLADRERGRLLLYAEMRLPGEAWLEFTVKEGELKQRAVFRPKGLLGRLYWYLLFPFHWLIFRGMARAICTKQKETQ